MTTQFIDPIERLQALKFQYLMPDPSMTVSEWADQRRFLTRKDSAEEGPWRTSRTPYLREPMNEFSISSPTQEIVLVFASQTGKSSAVNNCLGYAMDLVPGPALLVQPTEGMAKRYSKMRIAPMIESTPTLRDKVLPSRSRDSGNTMLQKEFINGAQLIIGGANSAASLASMPIRFAAEDEVDRFPLDVDEEGSPSDLVDARLRTFGDRKKRIKTSTPTLAGRSRIWWEWEQSDQRQYHVPCPHCKTKQILTWDKLRYDPKDPLIPLKRLSQPPVMMCEACGEGFGEGTKAWWYGEDLGEWIPGNPGSIVRGYHLAGFYSPLGWLSWSEIVLGYVKAGDDPVRVKAFVNTVLAECYAETGEVPDWEALYRRREQYQRGVVTAGGLVLTAAADIQRDRIELEVVAWGPQMESWSVDYIVLAGDTSTIQTDPNKPCPWRRLKEELGKVYACEGGGEMRISKAAIDSGDQTAVVYAWVRAQADPRIVAVKGRGSLSSAVGIPSKQDVTYRGQRAKHSIKLWPVGVDMLKGELYGWLRQPPPLNEGDPMPRGFCHFPEYGEEHFQGLTAEQMMPRLIRGFTVYSWEKVRPRNEQLDCRVYNRAAATMLGVDRWPEEEWKRRRAVLEQAQAQDSSNDAQVMRAAAAPVPVLPKRHRRSQRRVATVSGR
jgi:phage terminase large subunit GpA-like protein